MITYNGAVHIPKNHPDIQSISKNFAFRNKSYDYLARQGKAKYISEFIKVYRMNGNDMIFPRGCLQLVEPDQVDVHEVPLTDEIEFIKQPYDYQEEAAESMMQFDNSFVRMPTGSGKTAAMIYYICQRQQKTLVLVPTKGLVDQWIGSKDGGIKFFTGYDAGRWTSGKKKVEKEITIATFGSVSEEFINQFGLVIVDEAHTAGGKKIFELLLKYKGRYLSGCTATEMRSDGIPIMPVVFQNRAFNMEEEDLIKDKKIIRPNYNVVVTPFRVGYDGEMPYTEAFQRLMENEQRTAGIVYMTKQLYDQGRTILILSQSLNHIKDMSAMLEQDGYAHQIAIGETKNDERTEIFDSTRSGGNRILIGSTIADQGLDIKNLDTLILASPSKFKGRILQRVGRAIRTSDNKHSAEIFDIADLDEPLFLGQFKNRWNTMKEYFGIDFYNRMELPIIGGKKLAE